jgi:hypothetical protein
MGRKKRYNITPFKDYESPVENENYQVDYVRMLDIQLICMNELSANAFRLYIMMKSYANGEVEFEFPYRVYKNFICKQTFTTARKELIDLGYIEPFNSHKTMRVANKYRFSSKWRERNKERISEIVERRKTERCKKKYKGDMV